MWLVWFYGDFYDWNQVDESGLWATNVSEFYTRRANIVTIETVSKDSPFGKKKSTDTDKSKIAGDYIMKTEKTKLTIITRIID
jgi:hypothetical protein